VLSGRGLLGELITRPKESYRVWRVVVSGLETSRMRRPEPTFTIYILRFRVDWVLRRTDFVTRMAVICACLYTPWFIFKALNLRKRALQESKVTILATKGTASYGTQLLVTAFKTDGHWALF
jgi:hypothetical protein